MLRLEDDGEEVAGLGMKINKSVLKESFLTSHNA